MLPPRSTPGTLVALALSAAVALGCKRETVTYTVAIDTDRLPRSAALHLVFRGAAVPLAPIDDGRQVQGTFSAAGEQWLSEDVEALRLEIEAPCGPVVLPYRHINAAIDRDWVRAQEKRFRSGAAPLALGAWSMDGVPDLVLVHVDRRDAAGVEVAIGKQVLRPGAGIPLRPYSTPYPGLTGDVYEIAVPTCPEGSRVRVGSDAVGEVKAGGRNVHALIDAKGGHCYEQVDASYTRTRALDLPFLRPARKSLSGSRVYGFDNGPPRDETDKLLASCPSMLTGGRSSCTDVHPSECEAPPP